MIHYRPNKIWWSQAGSNRRPPACKAGALPAELWPQNLSVLRYAALSHSLTRSLPKQVTLSLAHAPPCLAQNILRSPTMFVEMNNFCVNQGSLKRRVFQYTSFKLTPSNAKMVGLGRFELPTSPLSGVRSNQLSYRPID